MSLALSDCIELINSYGISAGASDEPRVANAAGHRDKIDSRVVAAGFGDPHNDVRIVELLSQLTVPYSRAFNTIRNSVSREGKVMQKRPEQEYTPRLGRVRTSSCRAIQAAGSCRKPLLGGPARQFETLGPKIGDCHKRPSLSSLESTSAEAAADCPQHFFTASCGQSLGRTAAKGSE